MRTCQRVLALMLAILTTVLLLLSVNTLNLRLTLLNPAFLKGLPVRYRVYERLPGLAIDVTLEEMARGGGEEVVAEMERVLGREALEGFVEALVPPAWVQQQVEQNIDVVFAWLEGETAYPDLRLELGELREQMIEKNLREALLRLLAHLPPCESEYDFYSGDYPHCRPSDAVLDMVVEEAAPEFRRTLPEDLSLQEALEAGKFEAGTLAALELLRQAYRSFIWSTWAMWLACPVMLGLVLLLAARNLEQVLRWAGWPMLVAGGLEVTGLVIGFATAPLSVENELAQLPSDTLVSLILLEFARSFLKAFIWDVLGHWMILAGGLMFLGANAVIAAALISRVRAEE
jgi:hypothetical protein